MEKIIMEIIAERVSVSEAQVDAVVRLLDDGSSVPFIARYRKEQIGSLDEVSIAAIQEQYGKMQELEKRKLTILATLEEQGNLTADLQQRIAQCYHTTLLEDIYLPFKPKRRTRATIAREKGLEPLARILMAQFEKNPQQRASVFLNENVASPDEALAGARDIIAEWISENEKARHAVRRNFGSYALIQSKVVKDKEEAGVNYRDYFEWQEPLKRCPSHRLLAMRRGEKEGFLRVSILPDRQKAMEQLTSMFVKGYGGSSEQVKMAAEDSFKRLVEPSIETEFAASSKEKADREAIAVFAENLRQLLLAPPLGYCRVLAIDPGFYSGCKIVCLDAQGNLLHNDSIYPHPPQNDKKMAAKKISSMVEAYQIEAIAIGNRTAGRETEDFIRNLRYNRELKVFSVNEDGASVYSASGVAREEFPQYDVTVRGAISIGRRLMDPLAELVKIDPKSIGVGQYQHDVDQKELKNSLDRVVESVVNNVGVNVNTASKQLLAYVSGLGLQLAQNIVDYRRDNGNFTSRSQLLKVPRMGAKSFEQSAGFIRIPESENPLDNSAVHPEAYPIVKKMAADLNCPLKELIDNEILIAKIDLQNYITPQMGLPTLTDIKNELLKPGRDPRKTAKVFAFADGIYKMEDLKTGMILPGIVSNITKFGAFVDIGVKQSGLVHLSELANRFVSDPNEIVRLNQHVMVKVIEVDIPRKRIQLSLKQVQPQNSNNI
ncbi:MAG: RNA-binding transcriptional accessory protein [Prolixibacteraceae bacterium]|nr:RNA-binding transcriptional accessory protein [Prolixibacteraceae bacterium]